MPSKWFTFTHSRWRRIFRRLTRHHFPIAIGVAAGFAVGIRFIRASLVVQLTIVSASLAVFLLAATLLVSPLMALQGRRVVASSDLRRDLGIWSGVVGLIHVAIGLCARFGQAAYGSADGSAGLLMAAAGLTGMVAAAIMLALLALSNDAAIRGLGLARWKRLQRTARWLPPLVGLHGVAWLLVRSAPTIAAALAGSLIALVALRAAATWRESTRLNDSAILTLLVRRLEGKRLASDQHHDTIASDR